MTAAQQSPVGGQCAGFICGGFYGLRRKIRPENDVRVQASLIKNLVAQYTAQVALQLYKRPGGTSSS
jgi:hypothetical protein